MSDEDPLVSLAAGQLRGVHSDGVSIFKGIRYGEPTASRRFQRATPAAPWSGVRNATSHGNRAPQWALASAELTGESIFDVMSDHGPVDEDCLFLNVWTAAAGDDVPRPVMVWLHGGGFAMGEASAPIYDGARLAARHDVVVVSIHHRLNVFGYLYFGDGVDEKYADSGNVGSLDIVLALEWVRDNIAEFGGDPGNVTIFGESGGGAKVSVLTEMPAAKGLFHKGIVQSGAVLAATPPDEALRWTTRFMATLGLAPTQVDELAAMPAERISEALNNDPLGIQFSPVVDERSLSSSSWEPGVPSVSNDVPLLVGTNKDETTVISTSPRFFALQYEQLAAELAPQWLPEENIEDTIAELRQRYPLAMASDIYFRVTTWAVMRRAAIMQAELRSARRAAPVYMYLFAWESPAMGGMLKAFHAAEIPFAFDNLPLAVGFVGAADGPAQVVADAVSGAWTSFARTGNPGWPPYDTHSRQTMIFDLSSRVEADPDAEDRALLWGKAYNPFLDWEARADRPQ